ncbi:MAG TPA: DUF3179 domain-containing protein [Planctomycetes bacterium]|nr:DUF3179 domain-containing protein [Planctomycetota bacterium]
MVHERRIKETGEVLELRVSGQVRLGNLIMFDKESDSHWLQETGRSLSGKNEGCSIPELDPDEWTPRVRWDEWKKLHADSKVLYCSHCEDQ